jgi:hypothetical protein
MHMYIYISRRALREWSSSGGYGWNLKAFTPKQSQGF